MFRKYLLPVVIGLVLAVTAFADQAAYISKADAERAALFLKNIKQLKHFCAPCDDKSVKTENILTVEAAYTNYQTYWEVRVNGKGIDLAYVYFYDESSASWKNLALHLKLAVSDVPLTLQNEPAPAVKTTPKQEASNPYLVKQDPNKLYWSPLLPFEDQFFTSYMLALAERQSENDNIGFVIPTEDFALGWGRYGVIIKNLPESVKSVKVKFTFQADRLADSQTFEETVEKNKENAVVFFPQIVWNLDAMRKADTSFSTNFRFAVSLNDQPDTRQNVVVRVRPMTDALYGRVIKKSDGTKKFTPSHWIFGAYVNEDHPWIDKLLKEALDTGITNSFVGYQGSEEDVYKQLFAIWNVMQRRGFKYSSITDSSNASRTHFSQTVRLFEDSINTSQSNCVDGSVLWVSILRKIGIKAYLVLVPGHCFIVIDTDGPKGKNLIGLETTVMGMIDVRREAQKPESIEKYGDGAFNQLSLNTFKYAVKQGTETYNKDADKLKAFDSGQPNYVFIDIEDIRQRKFFPLTR